MLNLRKISELVEENRKLKECLKRSSDLFAKAYGIIADQKKEIIYLRSCIQTLKTLKEVHLKPMKKVHLKPMADFQEVKKQFEAFMNEPTIIFPNTDERGLGEGDTPNDLSLLDF